MSGWVYYSVRQAINKEGERIDGKMNACPNARLTGFLCDLPLRFSFAIVINASESRRKNKVITVAAAIEPQLWADG